MIVKGKFPRKNTVRAFRQAAARWHRLKMGRAMEENRWLKAALRMNTREA